MHDSVKEEGLCLDAELQKVGSIASEDSIPKVGLLDGWMDSYNFAWSYPAKS
jgi:hypothetical protein